MRDLQLIQRLEQHVGFVIHRLTCDGNIYANAVDLEAANEAAEDLLISFWCLREALRKIPSKEKTKEAVHLSMSRFNVKDWEK
jgi:hypothetical protein